MTDDMLPDHYRAWCWEQGTSALDLVLKSVSRPVLQPDEVLVRNHVAGLNPVDWKALGARLALGGRDGCPVSMARASWWRSGGMSEPSGWGVA